MASRYSALAIALSCVFPPSREVIQTLLLIAHSNNLSSEVSDSAGAYQLYYTLTLMQVRKPFSSKFVWNHTELVTGDDYCWYGTKTRT